MNAADPHHYSFNEQLLPLAVEKQMGIIGMKIPGARPPAVELDSASRSSSRSIPGKAWCSRRPPAPLTMREAVYYTLSRPVSTIIVGCDSIAQLEENVQLARDFTPLSAGQEKELVAKAEPVAKPSLFFRFYDRP